MELRHLRYFLAVAEALNFTKAAALLRVAQPALSRRVQDLEDEIGVDLLKRSPRGVTLTAEGKLFLEKTRQLLKLADESVEQVRALARGQFGDLHIGYSPSPTVEILPPALATFQKTFPQVNVLLHDASQRELVEGLQNGTLELAITVPPAGDQTAGIQFEVLRTYPLCVAMTAMHPFARMKSIPLERLAAEPLVALRRKDYPEADHFLDRLFASCRAKPRIAVECDSASSLITEVEAGRGIALATPIFKLVAGKRLLYRPLTGTTEVLSVGIARATKGDVTPAGEKFCEILRKTSDGATVAKPKPARSF
ncbi:MAG TPA: LysR family transcriptional regulator [Candidatus Cybelea sp.]|nr:LysR family transcriptional regulator [Candidatus Cybelea sp.]